MKKKKRNNNAAQNMKAYFDYNLFDRFEAGIELKGAEVKSIRNGKANLHDSFARVERDGAYLYGMHVNPYEQSGPFAPNPTRVRRLLLHKSEIEKLRAITNQRGYTLVPVRLYFKKGFAKVEIAVARGKKLFDKREKMRHRTIEREIKRSIKSRSK